MGCKKILLIIGAEEKKRNIEIMLTELKQRKSELEQEVAEQQHFMKLDQAKRAMEYIIHENQLKEIQQKLSDVGSFVFKLLKYQIFIYIFQTLTKYCLLFSWK